MIPYLSKVNRGTSYEPAIQFLDAYLAEMCTYTHGETCMRIERGTLAIAQTLYSISLFYARVYLSATIKMQGPFSLLIRPHSLPGSV